MPNEPVAGLAKRLKAKLRRIFVLLILILVVVSGFRPVMDNVDLGWHVAQGRWMVQHAAVYRQDAFNYPNLGHPVIDEYPLFQVVLYVAWSLGWWGPCVLTALGYAVLVIQLIRAGPAFKLVNSSFLAFAIGAMLLCLLVAAPLRPHLVTYLGVTTLGLFLLRHREANRWTLFWPMALLQIAWTNCHGGFVLGPGLVGLFGVEMTIRHWLERKSFPWRTARTWLGAFLLILLSCGLNPYGWARFGPPFYQDRLESIRAYVGEMEPLGGAIDRFYLGLTGVFFCGLAVASWRRRGAVSVSFLIFALFFCAQAQAVQKAWPIFGLFLPLLALSCGAFAASESVPIKTWPGVAALFLVTALVVCALYLTLDPMRPTSLQARWRELDRGRSELSVQAVAWMRSHGVEGRLFHRCEDGGYLQQEGFDHGETFAETGIGKYDEAFIHEVGLVSERPALLPRYLEAYQPEFVVCDTFCDHWPFYLRQKGWRLVFYSPNSSVWARPGLRPDLPAVANAEIMAAFEHDLAANGRPADPRLYGRSLIALQSLGLEDFALTKLRSLPPAWHHAPWYWEAARVICFAEPPASLAHRDELGREAAQLGDDGVTAEFRADGCEAAGDGDGALRLLEAIPPDHLGNGAAELLLKIDLDRKSPEALALARRTDCFDLRNGRHWEYLAQAEEQAGHPEAAARAWRKAVFYYPDDADLMAKASDFATRSGDWELAREIAASARVYGASSGGCSVTQSLSKISMSDDR